MPERRRLTPEERAIPAWKRRQLAGVKAMTIRIDGDLVERLANAAAIDRRSLNSAVLVAVEQWCARIERAHRGED